MSKEMSQDFQNQENAVSSDASEKASEKSVKETVVFFSKASRLQIGNFSPENRAMSGQIIRAESPLEFHENVYSSKIPDEIEFIRKSNAFLCGDVRECENMAQALLFRSEQAALKSGVTNIRVSDIESTHITSDGEVVVEGGVTKS